MDLTEINIVLNALNTNLANMENKIREQTTSTNARLAGLKASLHRGNDREDDEDPHAHGIGKGRGRRLGPIHGIG